MSEQHHADLVRAQAEFIYEILTKMNDRNVTTTVELAKWLLTSVLAVNGAGLVAMSQAEIPSCYRVGAGSLFVLGMLLGVLAGYQPVKTAKFVAGDIGPVLEMAIRQRVTGEAEPGLGTSLTDLVVKAQDAGKATMNYAIAGLVFFGLAVGVAGVGILCA